MSGPHTLIEAGNSEFTCSSGCHLAANGPALFCLQILRLARVWWCERPATLLEEYRDPVMSALLKRTERLMAATNVTLELDDIRGGGARSPPHSLRGVIHLGELTTAPRPRVDAESRPRWWASAAAQPGSDAWASSRSPARVFELGGHAIRSDSFAWSSAGRWLPAAITRRTQAKASPEKLGNPLGTADVPGSTHGAKRRTPRELNRPSSALALRLGRINQLTGVTAIWRQNWQRCQPKNEPFWIRDGHQSSGDERARRNYCTNLERCPSRMVNSVLGYPDEMRKNFDHAARNTGLRRNLCCLSQDAQAWRFSTRSKAKIHQFLEQENYSRTR